MFAIESFELFRNISEKSVLNFWPVNLYKQTLGEATEEVHCQNDGDADVNGAKSIGAFSVVHEPHVVHVKVIGG